MAESDVRAAATQARDGGSIELRIEGAHGSITLRRFLDMMGDALTILRDLDSAIAADPRGTLDWYVTDLHSSDLIATVEQRPMRGKLAPHAGLVATTFVSGLNTLQEGATIPPYFSLVGLKAVEKLTGRIGTNGATGFRAIALGTSVTARVDRGARSNVDRVLAPRYKARGSVTGKLEMISVHRGRHFNIYELRTHRAIRCSFREDQFDESRGALGTAVVASGLVYRNANGDAIRLDVDAIRPWPLAASVPRVDEIFGIDPDFTGDDSTEGFLAAMRSR